MQQCADPGENTAAEWGVIEGPPLRSPFETSSQRWTIKREAEAGYDRAEKSWGVIFGLRAGGKIFDCVTDLSITFYKETGELSTRVKIAGRFFFFFALIWGGKGTG